MVYVGMYVRQINYNADLGAVTLVYVRTLTSAIEKHKVLFYFSLLGATRHEVPYVGTVELFSTFGIFIRPCENKNRTATNLKSTSPVISKPISLLTCYFLSLNNIYCQLWKRRVKTPVV